MIQKITKENYDTEVVNSPLPVLLDYFADWCAPCSMQSPIIDAVADEYDGKLKVGKINVTDDAELASQAAVVTIPTMIILKNGKVTERLVGLQSKDTLEETIERYI